MCLNLAVWIFSHVRAARILADPAVAYIRVLGAALLASVAGHAQGLPDLLPRVTVDPEPNSHSSAMLTAGDTAWDAEDVAGALRGYQRALVWRPFSQAVLRRLLRTSKSEPDSHALWAHALYAAIADKQGRVKIGGATRKLLPKRDPSLKQLAVARARACQALDKLVKSLGRGSKTELGSELTAQWVVRVAADLLRPAPALWSAHAADWSAAAARQSFDPMVVVDQLEASMHDTQADGNHALAFRIAGVLRGLAAQAADAGLLGDEPPDLDGMGFDAARVRAAARAALAEQAGEPWTFERLSALSAEEQAAFTQRHADPARPARVLSSSGRYLLETTSGFETAIGAAHLAELAHERLARWFGSDPFDDRRGNIRIVSETSDFEAEGNQRWWSSGYNAGELSVVRFACDGLDGLSRSLTHELTHRFDGVLNAFHPAWLSEGKAVWTAGAYKEFDDAEFIERHALRGPIFTALNRGYGRSEALGELIEGLADYRDNYTAGYALYLYLSSWRVGDRYLFRDRLEAMEKVTGDSSDEPVEFFEQYFADGREGRPSTFEDFADGFGDFLQGFGSSSSATWQWSYDAYQPNPPEHYVLDGPTWTWSHRPARPYFGQGQAMIAAEVLAEAGQNEAAIAAHLWARRVDADEALARAAELAGLLEQAGRPVEAWLLQPTGQLPEEVAKQLAKLQAFIDQLREVAGSYRARGLTVAAAALEADAARLDRHLGRDPERVSVDTVSLHPYDEPARALGSHGWVEDELLGHDGGRVSDNYFELASGDLHVGRGEASASSGLLQRGAYARPIFVRSPEWMAPGRYSIKTTVRLTTSYAEAALIFGYHRRDRFVRVGFQAGDLEFAAGRKAHSRRLTEVRLQVGSTFERETGLVGSAVKKRIQVESASAGFELEILIDGAQAVVRVDGVVRATYHVPNGAPIDGHVGFSAAVGAIRCVEPIVQRLDRSAFAGRDLGLVRRLGVDSGAGGKVHQFLNAPCAAFPRAPRGTIALWIPDEGFGEARETATRLGQLLEQEHVMQPVFVVVPATATRAERESLGAALSAVYPGGVDVIPRSGQSPFDRELWVLFSDGGGVLRVADAFVLPTDKLPRAMRRWAKAWAER